MKRNFILIIIFSLSILTMNAQEVLPANIVMKEAYSKAAKEHKNVMVIFHASWCGWCHKMDSSLNDASVKNFFDNNYVIVHLTVHESKGKENLENPGALEMLTKYKGEGLGIPFWLVFDKNGNLLGDALLKPGVNVGCPA